MTPNDRFNAITEQGLCAGCGLCQSLLGKEVVEVTTVTTGYERPILKQSISHADVDRVMDVCPGTRVDGLPAKEHNETTQRDLVWGSWQRMVRAYAGDENVRHQGSTGGVLTALAQCLLEQQHVDFILQVAASEREPGFGEAVISESAEDVLRASGSRYGPAAPLKYIHEALDRGQRFAFIGKPCDVSALRNLARHDPRVDELVVYTLTMVCGGFMPPESLVDFMDAHKIDGGRVNSIRYRGFGCPGPTVISTDTEAHEYHYLDFWGEDASAWHLPFRCKVCPDGIGESADLVAADTWIGGSPDRADSEQDLGANAIMARTEKGRLFLEAAVNAGALVIEREIGPKDMSDYQPHQVRKKQAVFDRYLGLRDEGRYAPVTYGLRLAELAEQVAPEVRVQQRLGTRERVRRGKASEPTPALRPKQD